MLPEVSRNLTHVQTSRLQANVMFFLIMTIGFALSIQGKHKTYGVDYQSSLVQDATMKRTLYLERLHIKKILSLQQILMSFDGIVNYKINLNFFREKTYFLKLLFRNLLMFQISVLNPVAAALVGVDFFILPILL